MKKKFILVSVLFVLFFVIGVIVPFVNYRSVTNIEELDIQISNLLQDIDSSDRALILETSQSALEERIRLVNMATKRIVLSTFDLREGSSTDDFFAVLLQKANQGVEVSILVDGISGFLRMKGTDYFSALASHEHITIKFYNPVQLFFPWRLMGRMHDKYVIVDDIGYILGGRNTFDYFLGDYESSSKSLDREVLIYHSKKNNISSVFSLYEYFEEMWNGPNAVLWKGKKNDSVFHFLTEHYEVVKKKYASCFSTFDYEPITKPTKGVHLLHNSTDIYGKEPKLFYLLNGIMRQGKEEVIIHTPYVVFNDYMSEELRITNEHVPITFFYNSVLNGDNIMASSDYLRNQDLVLRTGAKIEEFIGGISYHGKSIAIDTEYSIIGSYNFDLRSTYVNTEMMVLIHSEEITKDLKRNMENLSDKTYEVNPDGSSSLHPNQEFPVVSKWKRFLWKVIGFVMQPFRFFV